MSYVKIWVHAVWSTKNRNPVLKPPILAEICAHIKLNAKQKGIYIDRINGHDDHIHVLMILKTDNCISRQMQLLKGESAYWANKTGLVNGGLEWSPKYYASAVCDDRLDIIRRYIDNQRAHHAKQTFEQEYKAFLKSLGYDAEDLG
jgi:putative transposase